LRLSQIEKKIIRSEVIYWSIPQCHLQAQNLIIGQQQNDIILNGNPQNFSIRSIKSDQFLLANETLWTAAFPQTTSRIVLPFINEEMSCGFANHGVT
jgi:hypothetical protein